MLRPLGPGKAPMIPALAAAITMSGPDTRNIGAATTGIRKRDFRAVTLCFTVMTLFSFCCGHGPECRRPTG